ncbi:hypothetical protein [Roseibacillus persicicus]|uniref:Uncharacterized protein n=1 Tax=Roseibacillus persicicus TaxID=454148 RepID=A0A918WMH4_9BACT|nr:hypothetical protein [Roseibacillus persicicus]MDQ8191717.1 hypothetical protein [Roseibacillus persicicus]GHC63908.1 hypothetical protein GCM10007100_34380 [Roseibacillus persicicus]
MLLADAPETVLPPKTWRTTALRVLFWLFMLSFAFDYRAETPTTISTLVQYGFLAMAAGVTGLIVIIGAPFLAVRPGAWLLGIWALFLAFMAGNAILQDVPFTRFLKTGLPFFLTFAAMLNSHITASSGVRLAHLATPVFVVAMINIVWRIVFGLAFTSVDLDTARSEILSPALSWSAAFIGCSILLRNKFHWTMLLAIAALFTAMLLSITRSLIFPITASALATSLFFAFGLQWGAFRLQDLFKRILPVVVVVIAGLTLVVGIFVAFPNSLDRWQERLFSPTDDRNMANDPSLLTRQAEAKAIFDTLDREPLRYVNGMGVGASFYWDDDYFPELYMVYDREDLELMSSDIWFAGHSIWTYSLFSGGFIALTAFIGLFVAAIAFSISSAAANASSPGPDYWLLFLPAVASICILSESATSNPFDERLLGMIFGATFSFAQAGYVRAFHLRNADTPNQRPASPIL